MEFWEATIGLGVFLCFISALLLASIQLRKAAKSGIYASAFRALNKPEISHAKLAGILFLAGAILVIIGIAQ
jgi:hypothetical protein